MHKEVLTKKQIALLPLVKVFFKDFGLVGGTAIALHIGHRQSIDFDLFSLREFDNFRIRQRISKTHKIDEVIRDEDGQYTLLIQGVRFTFFYYPFKILFSENFDRIIKLPDPLALAAMKAYALGRRPKWKDYVDLYFIIKHHFPIKDIEAKADQIFKKEFNKKLFLTQLAYFKDIDYSEKIIFQHGSEVSDRKIKEELTEFSLA